MAEKFILANCYNPEVVSLLSGQCQVSESQNTDDFVEFITSVE